MKSLLGSRKIFSDLSNFEKIHIVGSKNSDLSLSRLSPKFSLSYMKSQAAHLHTWTHEKRASSHSIQYWSTRTRLSSFHFSCRTHIPSRITSIYIASYKHYNILNRNNNDNNNNNNNIIDDADDDDNIVLCGWYWHIARQMADSVCSIERWRKWYSDWLTVWCESRIT